MSGRCTKDTVGLHTSRCVATKFIIRSDTIINHHTNPQPTQSIILLEFKQYCEIPPAPPPMQHVILFYKYAPLSSDPTIMAMYQKAMYDLCATLNLKGRVLIGMSNDAEGINGTLAGGDKKDVLAYTYAMLGHDWCLRSENDTDDIVLPDNHNDTNARSVAIHKFWKEAEQFFSSAKAPVLTIASPSDFKWSSVDAKEKDSSEESKTKDEGLFPDLQIKLVKEIIGTGGVLSSISIQDTSKGYLTPQEWHEEMKSMKQASTSTDSASAAKDTVLIDCRNHKEFEIGHFDNAVDPNTKTFEQFPRWVKENKSALKNKKILMYCTGGIRCEKASAYVRKELEAVSEKPDVKHLHGGIHKYLDKFGSDGFFLGKNFVFDRRVGVDAGDHVNGKDSKSKISVGKCLYCETNYDNFTADAVCTVCRERLLVCSDCKSNLFGEFHCSDHQHLKNCYFTNLIPRFTQEELTLQLRELESLLDEISIGKRYKQKRRTLQRQIERVSKAISDLKSGVTDNQLSGKKVICRSCGDPLCNGECWGVHGLKRKLMLEKDSADRPKKTTRINANKRSKKIMRRERDIMEIKKLGLSQQCNVYRCSETSIRCPPPFFRHLSTLVKGKWVGKSVQSVLQSEFHELSDTDRLENHFRKSLITLNGIPVNSDAALLKGVDTTKALSQDIQLKNMDVISRLTHWHEPPVEVPESIAVKKISIPKAVVDEYLSTPNDSQPANDLLIYCCNKPSTVPVHPTGPYLQNSLSLMVEAQEGLQPRSLLPCHRLDRCTSGLTLFCTNPAVARLLQVQIDKKMVDKSYVAKVKGLFPSTEDEMKKNAETNVFANGSSWSIKDKVVTVEAPIDVADVVQGLRAVIESGKPSKSKFSLLSYDRESDTSLVQCNPITGRQHQLRVHLNFLGFPIHNDILYGGIIEKSEREKMETHAAQTLRKTVINDSSTPKHFGDITEEATSAAKDVCLVCQGNFEKKFNSSQLLAGGHSIDLHAMVYTITFEKKKRNKEETVAGKEIVGILECKSNGYLPEWCGTETLGSFLKEGPK